MTPPDKKSAEARPVGRPSVEEGARIDEAILSAARQVLFDQGEAATVNAVAKAAGLSRKSVYARYASRTDLFSQAIRQMLTHVGPVAFEPAGRFEDSLCNYLTAALRLVSGDDALTFQRVLALNPDFVSGLRDMMLQATRKIFVIPLVEMLETAAQAGEIAIDDARTAAGIIVNGLFVRQIIPDFDGGRAATIPNEEYARQLARMMAMGMVPR
jgi:TetR/AcrR family transcriptional regulator, mexJK operon transcriptional repressor